MFPLKSCKRNNLPAFGGSRKRKGKRKGKRSARRRAKKMHKKRNKSNKRYVSSPRAASEYNLSSRWSPPSPGHYSPPSPAYTRKRSPAHQLRDFLEDKDWLLHPAK